MKTEPTLHRAAVTLIVGTLALLTAPSIPHRVARAAELPRYKLQVGQEWTYRTPEAPKAEEPAANDSKAKRPRPKIVEEYVVTVVGQNSDGSLRLAFRNNMKYGGNDRWESGYFDMAAD